MTAQAAGVLTFLEPVSAIVLAWAFLDQSLPTQGILGGALVLLAGIAVVAARDHRQPCQRGRRRDRIDVSRE